MSLLNSASFTVSRAAMCVVGLVGALSAGCAETDAPVDAGSLPAADAGPLDSGSWLPTPTPSPTPTPGLDASVSPTPTPTPTPDAAVTLDATVQPDATTPVDASKPSDATVPLDADVFTPIPTDTKPSDWKLKPGSAKECPAEPPPIPIIGGLCAGIYFMCGWETSDGRQYSCTCDWVHYLCI